jgi:nonsense-mediated mRNA decay protein 3
MERESPELLSLCLKKVKNLSQVKLVDSKFIYTEPHSRRIKVQVVVQKEIQEGVTVQDQTTLEFEEVNQQCNECKKEFTPHTWVAVIQVVKSHSS